MSERALTAIRESDCPYVQHKGTYDYPVDWCEISDKPCLLESGLKCDTYEEVKDEQKR